MKSDLRFVTNALVLCLLGCCFASAATISGSVSDDNGNSIPGALVKLTSVRRSGNSTGPGGTQANLATLPAPGMVSAAVSSAGQFEFADVAPGTYSICVVPNDRVHVNACSGRSGGHILQVAASDLLVESDLQAIVGAEVSITIALKQGAAKMPTKAFLASAKGTFYPMENETEAGRFWAVVPPQSDWRLVTATVGGPFSLPAEPIHAGTAGVPVSSTVSR